MKTNVQLWWVWIHIAVRHAGQAKRARAGQVTPGSFESKESAALSEEFRAALVAIVAVALAFEAIDIELGLQGHTLNAARFAVPPKTNKGFYVAQRLIQAFDLPPDCHEEVVNGLVELFELRNDSVHFESITREGVRPHPSGTHTAEELTIFTLERSLEAIEFGRGRLVDMLASIDAKRAHPSAVTFARELPGVLGMLDEVAVSEGLELR